MVEDILSEVRCHFFVLFKHSMLLLSLVEGVVAAESLALTFSVLLEEKW